MNNIGLIYHRGSNSDSACDYTQPLHALLLTEFRSCVKVEMAFLGSWSLIVFMVSVDVKQH